MSDYKLKTYVHAVELDDNGSQTGRTGTFGPDDDLSKPENEWALAAISNPDVWQGKAPPRREPPPAIGGGDSEKARLLARIAELEAAAEQSRGSDTKVPPRSGPGSGAPEWRAYARSVGVDVDDNASRDDVVAALEAADKPITK